MKKTFYILILFFLTFNLSAQEIDIRGKNVSITDGSTTTTLLNSTDFGKQQSSAGTIVQKFTIYNTGNAALTIGAISFSGTNSTDFSVTTSPSSSIAAGNSTTFEVSFNPGGTGNRTANISIVNNDGNENPYDFNIAGTGIADRTVRWVNNQGASRPSTVTLQGLTYNTASTTYTNINAALVAAGTNDIVYITDGTYRNSNGTTSTNCSLFGMAQDTSLYLNVNKSNIIITSETGDYSTSNAKLVGYGFNLILEFSTDITIQGLKMDSVRTNAFWNSNTVWGPSAGVKILKNYVTNTYGHGIKTDGAIQVSFSTFNRGVWEIKGNHFENIGFYKYSACSYQAVSAIWLSIAGPVVEITDNTIINTKWAGVLTVGHGSNSPSITNGGITISNNIIEKTVDAGIQIGFPTDAYFFPSNALISGNYIKEANTSNKVGIGGITMLYSDLVETKILNNHITQSFNGLAIEIAGWQAKTDTTIVRYNNFCSLSGGFAITHIAGISPNCKCSTGDDLAKYKFDNNYWGDPTGPKYAATNSTGKGEKLRKDTITLGGGTYSLNDYNYLTPFSASPNTVVTAGSCLCPPEINVKGRNVNIVDGDITPSLADSTDFGNQSVCTGTVVKKFKIFNTGGSAIIIDSMVVRGVNASDFTITSPASSISQNDSVQFKVTFNPSANGTRNATVRIYNNDCDEALYDFAITGNGTDPEAELRNLSGVVIADEDMVPDLSDSTDFGSATTCTGSVVHSFRIYNTGNANLVLNGFGLTSGNLTDFSNVGSPSSPITPGNFTTFKIRFKPTTQGLRSATLGFGVNDCDEGTHYMFKIQGTGVGPEINVKGKNINIVDGDITPSLLDSTNFGSSIPVINRQFKIYNLGSQTLNISSIVTTGTNASDFTISNAPSTIAANDSAKFNVTFNASSAGIKNATININSNDCDEALYNFDIKAEKIAPCLLSSAIPTAAGTYTSTQTAIDGSYTCFCDVNSKLLLALDLNSTGAVIPNNGVSLQIGSTVTTAWNNAGGIIGNPFGGVIFNRKWNVSPTTQPTSPVKVKFFFTQLEYDSVKVRLSTMGTTITSPTQFEMYKLFNNGFGDPHASGATGIVLTNSNNPGLLNWKYAASGTDHSAEFLVSSFSGGGGGAGAGAIPLPVEFVNFTAKGISNASALLKWQTATEVNANFFEVERSLDGINFIKIGTVKANGANTGNYQYIDNTISMGIPKAFYKIKQVDVNGKSASTHVQLVNFGETITTINVYPNPFNEILNVELDLQEGETASITITDAMGKVVYNSNTSQTNTALNLKALASGLYNITIHNNSQTQSFKLMKP